MNSEDEYEKNERRFVGWFVSALAALAMIALAVGLGYFLFDLLYTLLF